MRVSYQYIDDVEVFDGCLSQHKYQSHYHEQYTLVLVEQGSVNYWVNNQLFTVNSQQFFLIPPYTIHHNVVTCVTQYKAIFIPIHYLVNRKLTTAQVFTNERLAQAVATFYQQRNKQAFQEILNAFSNASDSVQAAYHYAAILESITLLTENNTNIAKLAATAAQSKFHYQRQFKHRNGITVHQLKLQLKASAAKSLLLKGHKATDVAYELAYTDQSHFIKQFKRMWATTPKQLQMIQTQ